MEKVPKNSVEHEESEWLFSVRSLTSMVVIAAGIIGWCPVQYTSWAFYSVALIAFFLYKMFQSRTWDHVSVYIVDLMAPLQLVIAASLLPLLWTIHSPLSLPVSQNVTDSLLQLTLPLSD